MQCAFFGSHGLNRRPLTSALLVFAVIFGCGGKTTGGAGSESGVAPDEPIGELSPAEQTDLCDWFLDAFGGAGTVYRCDDYIIRVREGDCEIPTECDVTVEEYEACVTAVASRARVCASIDVVPECDVLEARCGGGDDVTDDGEGVAAGCAPGSAFECTCDDGSPGAQLCRPDGTFGDCECERFIGCVEGEQQSCACPNGNEGIQTCEGGGFSPCECPRSPICVDGQSRACACPDGEAGAQFCQGGVFTACECTLVSGSCNPNFCPDEPEGFACCQSPNGPCGTDYGQGCVTR